MYLAMYNMWLALEKPASYAQKINNYLEKHIE